MVKTLSAIALAFTLLFNLAPPGAWATEIQVYVDRNPVALGESFHLTFESAGSVDDDPDFSPLEADFEILGNNRSSNISIINGNVSRKTQWQLTAMARRSGRLEIPAISFGSDRSAPLALLVNPGSTTDQGNSEPIRVEVEANPREAFVQQQIRYQVRLLRNVEIANATLSEPKLTQGDALIEKIGEDRTYENRQNGLRYIVVERNYAVFPQQSGPLIIAPVVFQGTVLQGRPSLLDPFGQSGTVRRVQSASMEINIKAIPKSFTGKTWLPSSQLRLIEEWSENPPVFRVGEPVTRTLTLYAEGLNATQLPKLDLAKTEGLKLYPDQPQLENQSKDGLLVGARQQKIALVPTRAGIYRLPALEIPWWNIATGQMELTRLPGREIEVLPAATSSPAPPREQPPAAEIRQLPKEKAPAEEISAAAEASKWRRISLGLGLGWALTLLIWAATRRKRPGQKQPAFVPAVQENHQNALGLLKQSCRQNDPRQAKAFLMQLARATWGETAPTSLRALADRCPSRLREELLKLNRTLYHPMNPPWEGASLYQALSEEVFPAAVSTRQKTDPLEPLYKG